MGIVSTTLSQSNNMKFLLVLAVAAYARAEAEAKPGFVYSVGHPLTYAHHLPLAYHHAPLVYAAGCRNNDGALVPCAQGVLPALAPLHAVAAPVAEAEDEAVVSVEKREAEAEPTAEADAEADPEADPWLYYHGLGYAAHPYGYGYYGHHLGYAGYYGHHLGYAGYGYYGHPLGYYGQSYQTEVSHSDLVKILGPQDDEMQNLSDKLDEFSLGHGAPLNICPVTTTSSRVGGKRSSKEAENDSASILIPRQMERQQSSISTPNVSTNLSEILQNCKQINDLS